MVVGACVVGANVVGEIVVGASVVGASVVGVNVGAAVARGVGGVGWLGSAVGLVG